jgi:hypothetical protein
LRVNKYQHLASVTAMGVRSLTFQDAVHEAASSVMPWLNQQCFRYNVGVNLTCVVAEDETGEEKYCYYYRPYQPVEVKLNELKARWPIVLVPLLSLYREANSTTNPFYQVILLRTIMEGLELHNKAYRKHSPPDLLPEVFPDSDRILAAYRGKKFSSITDDLLLMRNFFAHFSIDRVDVYHDPSNVMGRRNIENAMPTIRYALRVRLDNLRLRILEDFRHNGHELPEAFALDHGI